MNNCMAVMWFKGSDSNMHSEANPPLNIIQQYEKQAVSLSWLSNIQNLREFAFQ